MLRVEKININNPENRGRTFIHENKFENEANCAHEHSQVSSSALRFMKIIHAKAQVVAAQRPLLNMSESQNS
jgi:hypothetical protein